MTYSRDPAATAEVLGDTPLRSDAKSSVVPRFLELSAAGSQIPPSPGIVRVGGGLLPFLGQFVTLLVSVSIRCVSATYQLCISVDALSRS